MRARLIAAGVAVVLSATAWFVVFFGAGPRRVQPPPDPVRPAERLVLLSAR